jgi:D-alanyl-D-alanine carboxypeptidase
VVLADPSATPTEVTIPSPTPKPSSKLSPLWPPASAPAPVLLRNTLVPYVDAAAVVIMDEASGAVLWENNAETPLAPASLTKIATAVIALQTGGLDRVFTSDVDSKAMPGSSVMGLIPGDEFTLQDLLYGLMLPSGNDAALVIARGIAGSDAAFVAKMNLLATALGLMETHFVNPHGLSANGHETSAYDLAVLTRYAMSVPGFQELAKAYSWTAHGSRTIGMYNANAFVSQYSGGDGVKVGYTRRAGHTLVASATRNGHRVYAVLLNAPNSQADAAELLDWAFANYTWPTE